ncbi:MAG: MFS transporter [Bacillota bacterium]|nr:MFS transporter [Bacillota bacterium]
MVALITKAYLGNLADKYGNLILLLICLSMSFVSSLAFTIVSSFWLLLLLLILMGTFMLSLNTLINSYVMKSIPEAYRGIGFGLFGTLYTLIYSLGPSITGLLAEKYSLQSAMQSMTLIFLLVIPLVISQLIKQKEVGIFRKEFLHDVN